MDIIKQMYYGKVCGVERKSTSIENKYIEKESVAYDKLASKLSTENLELVKNYILARDKRECITDMCTYKHGFKTALKIVSQSFIEK